MRSHFQSRYLVATSLMAALLGLAACGERTDNQTVGQKVDQAISKTAEAGREIRDNSKEAGKELSQAAQKAGATVGQETREVAAESKTAVMGAAAETKQASSTLGQKVDDALITSRVNAGFAADKDLSALKIDVDTKDGVVTLMGSAPDATAKSRATEIAKNAKDVKSVNNQLNVKAS
ncbi:MAG TPA: BON domain-containing protein [Ramlibacter sp.]|nr:BON domain-containing protein [Ramlibacter sp.]